MPETKPVNLRAVILAEGGSDRLRPLTEHLPTALLPVGGTPILDRQIQALLANGITRITVVGGYRAVQVEQTCRHYRNTEFQMNPRFSKEAAHVSSLVASGTDETEDLLLLPGDLLVDAAAIHELATCPGKNVLATDEAGEWTGAARISGSCVADLKEEATGDADPELLPLVQTTLVNRRCKKIKSGVLSTRIVSMESLARSLARHGQRAPGSLEAHGVTPPASGLAGPLSSSAPSVQESRGGPLALRPFFKGSLR